MECAKSLDDVRLSKQILECAQILSTALRLRGCDDPNFYKTTHENHPIVQWAKLHINNFKWVLNHANCCLEERYRRTKTQKQHASSKLITALTVRGLVHKYFPETKPEGTQNTKLEPFPNCAANDAIGISFKHIENVHIAYQKYLSFRWNCTGPRPEWTNREPPVWVEWTKRKPKINNTKKHERQKIKVDAVNRYAVIED